MMANLFDERPMWTRIAISYRTKLDDLLIKQVSVFFKQNIILCRSLLQKYAFYIQSGPWGRLWCKFGYDPRAETESRQYQTLMVTFRQHNKIPERQRLKVSMDRAGGRPDNKAIINYVYEPGQFFFSLL